jgi:hypothetical protein
MQIISAPSGFEVLYNPEESKEIREYQKDDTIVINGSYF